RALHPDVAIVHVQRADPHGNSILWGSLGITFDAVRAARAVIVTAEEIVSPEQIRRDPNRVVVPGLVVAAVCEARWGAHPSPRPGAPCGPVAALGARRGGARAAHALLGVERPDRERGAMDPPRVRSCLASGSARRRPVEDGGRSLVRDLRASHDGAGPGVAGADRVRGGMGRAALRLRAGRFSVLRFEGSPGALSG